VRAVKILKFDENGLIPAIVQDALTGKVLMLGYMNEAALKRTQDEGYVCFYSRSRQTLWQKGETSGNRLEVVSVAEDCDADALLILAKPMGPTCHTGAVSCFETAGEAEINKFGIAKLVETIDRRYRERPEGSYTTYLFNKGLDKILKKVGEEATEVVIAAKNDHRAEFVGELTDLLFHTLVLMRDKGISTEELMAELSRRERS
jgi:phosphoribosyl-ATP pyrophosphohydrolase/phosphoribosyl-AMP cyclohydrolase